MSNYLLKHNENVKIILRVTIVGIVANFVLVALKLVAGLIFDNLSVVADAIHSASDLVTSLLLIIAVFISSPKRDKKHNYGHEKIESLVVLFFAMIIFGLGAVFIWQGIEGLISPRPSEFNVYLIVVTVISLVIKEALFWYGMYYAKKTRSAMLRADAWHSRSDSLSSVAVLIGLISSTFMANNILESVAVLIVSLFLFKVSFSILRPTINQLIDKAADKKDVEKILEIAGNVKGVIKIDKMDTRILGSAILVDLEIHIDGNLTVEQGHHIADAVREILENHPDLRIKRCNVHVNPSN